MARQAVRLLGSCIFATIFSHIVLPVGAQSPMLPLVQHVIEQDYFEVDTHTASAAEVLAAALQHYDRALLVGEPTFGNGVAFDFFSVRHGYTLQVTTERWYAPSGRWIQRVHTRLPNGEIVPVSPTIPMREAAAKNLPRFRTEHGRVVYGLNGLLPDLLVTTASSPGQRALDRIFDAHLPVLTDQLMAYTISLRGHLTPNFVITPAMRAALVQRLRTHGIPVDDTLLGQLGATHRLDMGMDEFITRTLFGDSTVTRREVRAGEDVPLVRALAVLRSAADQCSLFMVAQRLGGREAN